MMMAEGKVFRLEDVEESGSYMEALATVQTIYEEHMLDMSDELLDAIKVFAKKAHISLDQYDINLWDRVRLEVDTSYYTDMRKERAIEHSWELLILTDDLKNLPLTGTMYDLYVQEALHGIEALWVRGVPGAELGAYLGEAVRDMIRSWVNDVHSNMGDEEHLYQFAKDQDLWFDAEGKLV